MEPKRIAVSQWRMGELRSEKALIFITPFCTLLPDQAYSAPRFTLRISQKCVSLPVRVHPSEHEKKASAL
jgi:hypothetical protein